MNAQLKALWLVAGMAAGADSVDEMDLLRHGVMPALFGEIRAPSTLGSFLRAFTRRNVLQLEKVSRLLLADAKATGTTLRRDPINVAARTARHAHGKPQKRERQENHAHWYPEIAFTGSGPGNDQLNLRRGTRLRLSGTDL